MVHCFPPDCLEGRTFEFRDLQNAQEAHPESFGRISETGALDLQLSSEVN